MPGFNAAGVLGAAAVMTIAMALIPAFQLPGGLIVDKFRRGRDVLMATRLAMSGVFVSMAYVIESMGLSEASLFVLSLLLIARMILGGASSPAYFSMAERILQTGGWRSSLCRGAWGLVQHLTSH